MAKEVGDAIRQEVIVDASVTGQESLESVTASVWRLDVATKRLVESSPAASAYAAQLQSMGKGLEQIDIAGRGFISTAQLAAERFELLKAAIEGDTSALAHLADTEAIATDLLNVMGRVRRSEAEAMQQQIAAKLELAAASRVEVDAINRGFTSLADYGAEQEKVRLSIERGVSTKIMDTQATEAESFATRRLTEDLSAAKAASEAWADRKLAPATLVTGPPGGGGPPIIPPAAGAALNAELVSLEQKFANLTAKADAFSDHILAGFTVPRPAVRQLGTELTLLQNELEGATRSGLALGEGMTAAANEASFAVKSLRVQSDALRIEAAQDAAAQALALGRARGARGVLIGLGASWAAEMFLVYSAAQQLYRGLKSIDEWISSDEASQVDWINSWKLAFREIRDSYYTAIAQMIDKRSEFEGGTGAPGVALATKYGLTQQALQLPAQQVEDPGLIKSTLLNALDLGPALQARLGLAFKSINLGPLLEQAKSFSEEAGVAFDDAPVRRYADAIRAAGGSGTEAGKALIAALGPGLAAVLQADIDKAKQLIAAMSDLDKQAKALGVVTEGLAREEGEQIQKALTLAMSQGPAALDVYVDQHKGNIEQAFTDLEAAGAHVPEVISQVMNQYGLDDLWDKQAKADAKKSLSTYESAARATAAAIKDAFDMRQAGQKAADDLSHAWAKLKLPDLSPLQQALTDATRDSATNIDAINLKLASLGEKSVEVYTAMKKGLMTPGDAAIRLRGISDEIVMLEADKAGWQALGEEQRSVAQQKFENKSLSTMNDDLTKARLGVDKFAAEWRQKVAELPAFLAAPLNAEIDKISANALQMINDIIEEFKKLDAEGNLGKVLADPAQLKDFQEKVANVIATLGGAGHNVLAPALDTAKEVVRVLEQGFIQLRDSFGAIFSAGITGGLNGIKQQLSKVFTSMADDFGKRLAENVLVAFGAGATPESLGLKPGEKPAVGSEAERLLNEGVAQRQAIANAALATFAGVSQALTQQMSDVQAGVSAVVTGVSVGVALASTSLATLAPYVGIIVAAAVFIAHIFQSAAAKAALPGGGKVNILPDYSGANTGVRLSLTGSQNLTEGELAEINNSLQQTFDSFKNAYVQILMKFGDQFKDLKHTIDWSKVLGGWDTGAPSADWKGDMEVWLAQNLPRKIQDAFWTPLAEGFKSLGFSAAKIEEIRVIANSMKPQDAVKYFDSLVTTATAINADLDKLQKSSGFGRAANLNLDQTSMRQDYLNRQNPMFAIDEAAKNIEILAAGIKDLTGQAQIDQVNAVHAAMEQRYQAEMQLIAQIQNAIDGINKSFGDAIRNNQLSLMTKALDPTQQGHLDDLRRALAEYETQLQSTTDAQKRVTLENKITSTQSQINKLAGGAPDANAQIDFLKKHLDDLINQSKATNDPNRLSQISSEVLATIEQIKQIGQTAFPKQAAEFAQWAIDAETQAQQMITSHLEKIGEKLDTANQMLYDSIMEFINTFKTATDSFGSEFNNTTGTGDTTGTSTVDRPDNRNKTPGVQGPRPGRPFPLHVPTDTPYNVDWPYWEMPKGHGGLDLSNLFRPKPPPGGGGGGAGGGPGGGPGGGYASYYPGPPQPPNITGGPPQPPGEYPTAVAMTKAAQAIQDLVTAHAGKANADLWQQWAADAMAKVQSAKSIQDFAGIQENIRKGLESALGGSLKPEDAKKLSVDMLAMVEALKANATQWTASKTTDRGRVVEANQPPPTDRGVVTAADRTTTGVSEVNRSVQKAAENHLAAIQQLIVTSRSESGDLRKIVDVLERTYNLQASGDANKVEVLVRTAPDASGFIKNRVAQRINRSAAIL